MMELVDSVSNQFQFTFVTEVPCTLILAALYAGISAFQFTFVTEVPCTRGLRVSGEAPRIVSIHLRD